MTRAIFFIEKFTWKGEEVSAAWGGVKRPVEEVEASAAGTGWMRLAEDK